MFKVTKETDNHYLISHKDGHFLKIAKKGLSEEMHKTIQKMAKGGQCYSKGGEVNNPKLQQSHVVNEAPQNLAEGGEVEAEHGNPAQRGRYPLADAIWDKITLSPNADAAPQPEQTTSETPAPLAPSIQTEAVPAAPASMPQMGQESPLMQIAQKKMEMGPNLQGELNKYQQGVKAVGQAESEAATQQAGLKAQDALQQEMALNDLKAKDADFATESQRQIDEFKNGQVDFQRTWHNKAAGQKALNIMGILLSGVGGGMTGQPNMAMQVLDKEIQRDIDQQKTEMDKKQTLYGMYLKKYGTEREARLATMNAYHNMFAAKMEQVALQQNSPKALAQAQMFSSQKTMEVMPQLQQLWVQKAALSSLLGGGGARAQQGVDPIELNPQKLEAAELTGQLDKDKAKDARKEQGTLGEMNNLEKELLRTNAELQADLNAGKWNPTKRESAKWTYAGKLQHILAGKFNMEDAALQINSILTGRDIGLSGLGHKLGVEGLPSWTMKDNPETEKFKLEQLKSLKRLGEYPTLKGLKHLGIVTP